MIRSAGFSLILSVLSVLIPIYSAHADKAFCVCEISGDAPNIGTVGTDYTGDVLIGQVSTWGGYLISGTAAQLSIINALSASVSICMGFTAEVESPTAPRIMGGVMGCAGPPEWADLDTAIDSGLLATVNAWLTAKGLTTATAGTIRQVIDTVFPQVNADWDWIRHYVREP